MGLQDKLEKCVVFSHPLRDNFVWVRNPCCCGPLINLIQTLDLILPTQINYCTQNVVTTL